MCPALAIPDTLPVDATPSFLEIVEYRSDVNSARLLDCNEGINVVGAGGFRPVSVCSMTIKLLKCAAIRSWMSAANIFATAGCTQIGLQFWLSRRLPLF